jgi:hypothetical protein
MTPARAASCAFLVVVAATLCGCPFTSDKPLSDPADAVPDSRLIGTWRTQDPETREWNSLTILAFNEHEMVGIAPGKETGRVDAFRLFPTPIGADRFLSMQQLGGKDDGWYYARYEIVKDRLRLKIVDNGLFGDRRFTSSGQLADFIRQHLSDPVLYAPDADQPSEMDWERVNAST